MLVNDVGALKYYHAYNIELIKYYFLKDWKYVLNGTRIIIIDKNMEVNQKFLKLNEEEKRMQDCFIAEALITGDGVDLAIIFSASKMPLVQSDIMNIVKNASNKTGIDLEF